MRRYLLVSYLGHGVRFWDGGLARSTCAGLVGRRALALTSEDTRERLAPLSSGSPKSHS